MKFSEMNTKQLREARNELQRRMRDSLRPTRIQSLTDTTVQIDGGTFPGSYDHNTRELTIWGRGSRYSGGSTTIPQLQRAEDEVRKFYDEYLGGRIMTREEKIYFCVDSLMEFEGIPKEEREHILAQWEDVSDEKLDKEVDWFEYLGTK